MISTILDIVNKFIPDQDKKNELKKALLKHESELEEAFKYYAKTDHDLRMKELELKGFKASWRPYIMFSLSTVMVLYVFLYYLLPQIIVVFNINSFYLADIPEMPSIIWKVFAFCVVGVSGLRTIDKWRS